MKITFKKINKENLELACKIQNEIFPLEDARNNFLEQIEKNPYRKYMYYCIVYLDSLPIGVTGLYVYHEYPKDAWLGWFGILNEYRNQGYGTKVLNQTIKLAKEKNYTKFRLYTDEYAHEAHRLYESINMQKELYDNPDDKDKYIPAKIYIYSLSLTDKPIDKWNNKNIGLKEQSEKEH